MLGLSVRNCMEIARYHRVSTEDQSLERQVQATDSYIENQFENPTVTTYTDASTGTNTAREDYQQLMADVKEGNIDVVVVKSISRISRSIRDLEETVDKLHEKKTALHIIDESFKIKPGETDPMQTAMFQLLGVFAEFEAEMTRKRIKEGIAAKQESENYHHGPAPLGFEKKDGELYRKAEFDQIVSVLEMVIKDQLSKRAAAKELDTSRRTINRAIQDRPELYGVEDVEPDNAQAELDELKNRLELLEEKL